MHGAQAWEMAMLSIVCNTVSREWCMVSTGMPSENQGAWFVEGQVWLQATALSAYFHLLIWIYFGRLSMPWSQIYIMILVNTLFHTTKAR